jgi:hypothetical protein
MRLQTFVLATIAQADNRVCFYCAVSSPVPKLARGQSLSQYISRASDIEFQQAHDLFNLIDVDGKGRITSGEQTASWCWAAGVAHPWDLPRQVSLRRVFKDSGVDATDVRRRFGFPSSKLQVFPIFASAPV